MVDSLPGRVRDGFVEIVGRQGLLTDPEVIGSYVVDWTGRFRGSSPAVVRPGTVEEVAAVIELCRAEGVAVVPQGGNTGLVGGSVPLEGEVVLSLRRFDQIGPVDTRSSQVTVGAGVTLADVQRHAAAFALVVPVDLAARDSATIGGMVATNAGGTQVVRWGPMRRHLVGHEAVLGSGRTVRHLGGLLKDNTGYDIGGLLCGSEGTLGVLTAARLALVSRAPFRVTALCAFATADAAVDAAASWRKVVTGLEALELLSGDGLQLVVDRHGRVDPFRRRSAWYVLVEAAGRVDPTDELSDIVVATTGVTDVAVATGGAERARLWALREDQSTAINSLGPPHKLDVTLPVAAMAQFLETVGPIVSSAVPGARTWLFGHVGDGNVHVNVTGVDPTDDLIDEVVLTLVAASEGSISAEHGIGVAKKRWLHLNRTPAELEAFRSLKGALDPDGVLNPNVLL